MKVWQNDEGKYVFTMPSHDVKINCLYTQDAHNIYYMADAVTYAAVENVIAGTNKKIGDADDVTTPDKTGFAFNETWLCDDLEYMMNREGTFIMPSRNVYIYGYFHSLRSETVTKNMELCMIISSDDGLISKKLYYNVDYGMEMILPKLFYEGYTIEYSSEDVTIEGNKLTMPTDTSLDDIELNISLKKIN